MATTTHSASGLGSASHPAVSSGTLLATGQLLVRLALALPMIFHGASIALGAFGGPGLKGFVAFTHLPLAVAALVGWGELLGGLGVLFGVLTRLAAAGAGIIMVGAILLVHLHNGYDLAHKGYEYALTLALLSAAVILLGGGDYSVGALFHGRNKENGGSPPDLGA